MRQFQISNLLAVTAISALAIWSLRSPVLYFSVGIALCFGIAITHAGRNGRKLALPIITAILWANFPIACGVVWTVYTQHREQGELYYEDGPGVYFLVVGFVSVLFTLAGAAIGMFIGIVVSFFRKCVSRLC